jgi:hypothetical protein
MVLNSDVSEKKAEIGMAIQLIALVDYALTKNRNKQELEKNFQE